MNFFLLAEKKKLSAMFEFLYDFIDATHDYFLDKLRQFLIGVAPSVGLIVAKGPILGSQSLYETFYDTSDSDCDSLASFEYSVLCLEEEFITDETFYASSRGVVGQLLENTSQSL